MRKRSKEIIFRMTPDENCLFERKVEESGLTKQKYLLACALDKKVCTGKELEALTMLNQKMASQDSNLSEILRNLDDMTLDCEAFDEVPNRKETVKLFEEIRAFKQEGVELWNLIREKVGEQCR